MEQHISFADTARCSPLLNEIHDPPKGLYVWGTLPAENRLNIAFVGARMHTAYGKRVCDTLIEDLAAYPVTIVSGLALGMDTVAHKKALEVGLPTVAVVGSGVAKDVLYPRTHLYIAEEIVAKNGAVLSEYTPETRSAPYMFPQRNRIIAGMCRVVVIVECGVKSGTMITARLALESNREVFVVPHPLFSPLGEGPLDLIKHGAHLALDGHTLAEALGLKRKEVTDKKVYLTDEERVFLSHLSAPITKNKLIEKAGIPAGTAQALMIQLEIKGVLKEEGGLLYRRTR